MWIILQYIWIILDGTAQSDIRDCNNSCWQGIQRANKWKVMNIIISNYLTSNKYTWNMIIFKVNGNFEYNIIKDEIIYWSDLQILYSSIQGNIWR